MRVSGAALGYILRVRFVLFAVISSLPVCAIATGACSTSKSSPAPDTGVGPLDATPRIDGTIHVDAPCTVLIDAPAYLPASHVAIGTHVDYDSNPPSSGPHYPIWAAYQVWDTPVQREYYVHNLEHGAIVLLYKCADAGGCPDVVDAFKKTSDALPDDPLCFGGVRVRTVITPDPLIDFPIAAAAWGWTYRAECIDLPSLIQFAKDHYGQGPEQLCANGATTF
jgi:hypothetical protein